MPPGRPDRSLAAIVYVAPPLTALLLLAVELSRREVESAARFGLILLTMLPVLVYCYRRDFRPDDE